MAENAAMHIPRFPRPAAACAAVLGALLLAACTTPPVSGSAGSAAAPQPAAASEPAAAAASTPSSRATPSRWLAWLHEDCTPASQMDVGPQARYRRPPVIHASWFPDGLRTHVVFRLEVTPQGKLGRLAYLPADTDPRIVTAIMQSLQRWKFRPGMRQGRPVTACFEQPYDLVFPAKTGASADAPSAGSYQN